MRTAVSRRDLLSKVAIALPLTIAGTGASAAVKPSHYLDAALLTAWEKYRMWWKVIDDMPSNASNEELKALYERQDYYENLIETLPARTFDGLAVKLKYLFKSVSETRDGELAIMHDRVYHGESPDYRERMLLDLIADVQKMGGTV